MGVPVNGCDAYLDKMRKYCKDLIIDVHSVGAVSGELLLHTIGLKWKNK